MLNTYSVESFHAQHCGSLFLLSFPAEFLKLSLYCVSGKFDGKIFPRGAFFAPVAGDDGAIKLGAERSWHRHALAPELPASRLQRKLVFRMGETQRSTPGNLPPEAAWC